MPEDFISRPEFNNSMTAVREEIKRVGESVTQIAVKIDTLVNARVEEARMLGEMSGTIRSINERLERQERETAELRRLQETQVTGLKNQIRDIEEDRSQRDRGSIKWWHQLALLTISGFLGAILVAYFVRK